MQHFPAREGTGSKRGMGWGEAWMGKAELAAKQRGERNDEAKAHL